MQNSKLNNVKVSTGSLPRARFNLSHDVNTTLSWGHCIPFYSKMMYPDSKDVLGVEHLCRFAPMLSPTFGRVRLKKYHQFVDMDDIFPAFSAMMNETDYSGEITYAPSKVPHIPIALLSLFTLVGCKISMYYENSNSTTDPVLGNWVLPNVGSGTPLNKTTAVTTKIQSFWRESKEFTTTLRNADYFYSDVTGPAIDLIKLLPVGVQTYIKSKHPVPASADFFTLYVPSGNPNITSFYHDISSSTPSALSQFNRYQKGDVTPESADIIIPMNTTYVGATLPLYACISLSDFGRRLRTVLLGLGYQLDFTSQYDVSILPLLAYYKAYYETLGVQEEINFQNTACSKLISWITSANRVNLARYFCSTSLNPPAGEELGDLHLICNFIYSLADTFYTESQDYISAHQSKTTFKNGPSSFFNRYLTVANPANIDVEQPVNDVVQDASITGTPFDALDIKTLMRLYTYSNTQSIAGKSIAKALRAQGYDKFVDETVSHYIGFSDEIVPISDIMSQSDTYKDGAGSVLGEYAGRAVGYTQDKPVSYETNKFGYWISFMCVVPASGYSQGIDGTLIDIDHMDFHHPMFDGLGYQASPKSIVCGDLSCARVNGVPDAGANSTFGFVPRYSEWKVKKNIQSGDFSLRSTRAAYQGFCLDKEIPCNERVVLKQSGTEEAGMGQVYSVSLVGSIADMPTADSQFWRTVGKYPWIGSFDRIFVNFAQVDLFSRQAGYVQNDFFEFVSRNFDNILVQLIDNVQAYMPMKPIESSFGTEDENGGFDKAIEKA